MNALKSLKALTLASAFFACVSPALAGGTATNSSSVNSSLTLNATAETAITLTISTGSGGANVSQGGEGQYFVDFGEVNGLGIGTPSNGVSVNVGGGGATYTTPITVTPTFSGFSETTATVKVYQDAGASGMSQSAAREGANAASVSSVPSSSEAANIVASEASNGAGITRYVGVFVSNANGGSAVNGSLAPVFVYSVSVP